jgi:WD40 repeat protein
MHSVAYAADGSRVLTGTGSYSPTIDENTVGVTGQDEFALVLWDAQNGTELARFTGNRFAVSASAYSPDGRFVAAGCKDGSVHVWELATGGNLVNFLETSFAVSSVDFSPDGRFVLVAGGEGAELDQERLERELANLPGANAPPPDPPSPTEHYLSVDDRVLHVIEITTDNEVQLQGHQTPVGDAVFSPDGTRILSGAWDQTVRLWDVASGKELANFTGHNSNVRRVAFSRDGRFALSGDLDGEVRLWKLP